MATKLDIKRVLSAINHKDYAFYSSLTPDEQKTFSPYVLLRYISNSSGDKDIQEWFVEKTHSYVNKHHWDLSKNHKELLWLLYAAVGVGVPCSYQYLAAVHKEKTNKIEKLLSEVYPTMKLSDIKVMASIMTPEDKIELFDSLGFDIHQRISYE